MPDYEAVVKDSGLELIALKLLNFDLENIWPKMMRLMIDDTQNAA